MTSRDSDAWMNGPDPHARPLLTDLERYTGEHYRPQMAEPRHAEVSLAKVAVPAAIGILIVLALLLVNR
ncbi:MAG TPA: hypothetical protein VFV99_15810 [Kofleriaceae bacterium]|nr:hypothetical protein [Kofleriaceae bacterium]